MRIKDIRAFMLQGWLEKEHINRERSVWSRDIYPEFAELGPSERINHDEDKLWNEKLFIEVITDEGINGMYGPLDYQESILTAIRMLKPVVVGLNPLETEKVWDLMIRVDRHARAGMTMIAISAIDNALWDIKGKHYNEPVYRLLGGPTRDKIPAYASMLGHSIEHSELVKYASRYKDEGFRAQKWFLRYGPGSGAEGFKKNTAMVKALREALGEDYEIMLDAWMSWDLKYTLKFLDAVSPYRVDWIEEPFLPRAFEEYRCLRQRTATPIAAGEHLYTRWEFKPYLEAGLLDVIQPDPDWTGGITELYKIGHMAEVYGVKMLPHGCNITAAIHVVAAMPPMLCPMAEYLLIHKAHQNAFFKNPIIPERGVITLPKTPGLGIEIDERKIVNRIDFQGVLA